MRERRNASALCYRSAKDCETVGRAAARIADAKIRVPASYAQNSVNRNLRYARSIRNRLVVKIQRYMVGLYAETSSSRGHVRLQFVISRSLNCPAFSQQA